MRNKSVRKLRKQLLKMGMEPDTIVLKPGRDQHGEQHLWLHHEFKNALTILKRLWKRTPHNKKGNLK